jgi:hypothetical protein
MSTWRIEDVEDVEDDDSGAAESRLARKLASFGMGVQATIHRGEYKAKINFGIGPASIETCPLQNHVATVGVAFVEAGPGSSDRALGCEWVSFWKEGTDARPKSGRPLQVPQTRTAARSLGGQHFGSFLNEEVDPLAQFQLFPQFVSTRSWPSIHAAFISLSHSIHIRGLVCFAEIRGRYRMAMPTVCEFQPRRT